MRSSVSTAPSEASGDGRILSAMMTVQRERAHDLWVEILPLLHEHKEEISAYQDIALNPDIDRYNAVEESGHLRCYTARLAGLLVGYAIFFVDFNLHYSDSLQANQDVLFVTKPHRHGRVGYRLIRYSEEQLQAEGVQVCYQHLKTNRPETIALFHKLGYTDIDLIVAKRLDR
jgi:GNAT superfamily N-acetyltransferase